MIIQKVQQYTGLVPRTELEIDDNEIRTAIFSQGIIGWHNFLLGQTARQFEAIQQEHITATRQWNSAPFWAKNGRMQTQSSFPKTKPSPKASPSPSFYRHHRTTN
jgi:hypothetical protein